MVSRVQIRELAGWGEDDYEFRPLNLDARIDRARSHLSQRPVFIPKDPIVAAESKRLATLFEPHASRSDLLEEMSGLSWSLGVVDLRLLIAFQRRLNFPHKIIHPPVPAAEDWPALVAYSFGAAKPPRFERTYDRANRVLVLRSDNPNIHFRITEDPISPIAIHTGSPFFEIAHYADRWFLRDGYHRAFAMLRAGIRHAPAVVVETETLEQLGANQAWFFPEPLLFSQNPPLVTDFLEDRLVIEYERPRLIRTLSFTIQDTLTREPIPGEQI